MNRTMALVVLLTLSSAFLAGCADDKPDEPPVVPPEPVQEGKGFLHGVVVDPAIVPVAGARVAVDGVDGDAVTDETGAFFVNNLEPGTYFLTVSKVGYSTVQTSATVDADDDNPPKISVQIVPDPSNTPFIQQFQYSGFLQCSATAAVPGVVSFGGNVCGVGEDVGMPLDDPLAQFELARAPDFIQSELLWDSNQPAGDALQFMHSWNCDTNGGFMCDNGVEGVSPQVVTSEEATIATAGYGTTQDLYVRVFAASHPDSQGAFGITFDQEFEHFTTAFYGFLPDDGWVFIDDGTPAIPE